ncbi:hypothetical protein M3667_13595 [Microbacterium sp. P26]|uniref:hypothetical protein n=1 Tax=Microbacterium TaxID=33882 RepID=UPI0020415D52|nr:hypothetical protein [Microbacterium sp. P26]MCM3502904.1 hypothetical protein [Microbacterium sp. P26]
MDDDVLQELHLLRARAYGPDADIAEDPAAQQRLAQLEEQERLARAAPAPAPVDPPPLPPRPAVEAAAAASGTSRPLAAEGAEEAPSDEDEEETPRERRPLVRSKRSFWAWAISLAAVTALASAATASGLALVPVSTATGAAQVDVLVPDPTATVPSIFGDRGLDSRGYRDYFGVTAFVGYVQIDASENRSPCLYLLDTDEVDQGGSRGFRGNFVYGGCGAGVFPATVQFVVADGMPAAFVERFPLGTSVQFVFDGENVGVFADRDGEDRPAVAAGGIQGAP